MLYLDKEKITAQDLAEMFDLPFAKIAKTPIFECNPKDKKRDILNGGFITPLGKRVQSWFIADIGNGVKKEIRYAESQYDELVGERMVTKYEPLKVTVYGAIDLINDLELSIYLYLHPVQEKSPFRSQIKEPFFWSFVDDEARAIDEMSKYKEVADAMNSINALSGEKLKVLAKGMGVQNVDAMEDVMIKSALTKIAMVDEGKHAGLFNHQIASRETLFTGIIKNSIDREIFTLVEKYNTKNWVWNAGPNRGSIVVEVLGKSDVQPEKVLIDHINGHINDYYGILIDLQTEIVNRDVAKRFLDDVEIDEDKIFGGRVIGATIPEIPLSDEERKELEYFRQKKNEDLDLEKIPGTLSGSEPFKSFVDRVNDITNPVINDPNRGTEAQRNTDGSPYLGTEQGLGQEGENKLSPEQIEANLKSVKEEDVPDFLKPSVQTAGKPKGGNRRNG